MTHSTTLASALPLAFLLVGNPLSSTAQGRPELADPVRNFDYVPGEAAEPTKLRWLVLNAGSSAFTATAAQSSSPALSARWRNTAIEPGQYLVVEGSFDPKQHAPGRVVEQLQLKTDAGTTLRLTAVGYVLGKNQTAPPAPRATPAPDRSGNSYGYINYMGMEEIAPAYEGANQFADGRAGVKLGGSYGYINTKGAFVTEPKYRWCSLFHEGLGVVRGENNKWGVVDLSGQEVVPCQYDDVSEVSYSEGTLGVVKDGHGLLIDGYGRDLGIVKDAAVQEVTPLVHGVALFKKGGKWGIFNAKGEVVLPPTYDSQKGGFRNGCALVERGGKKGFVNEAGQEVVPCTLSSAHPFSEGKASGSSEDGKWQAYDPTGKVLFSVNGGELFPFHDGRALLSGGPAANFAKGFVDAEGQFVLKPSFQFAFDYSGGYAAVGSGPDNWGYFDWSGKGVINNDYQNAGPLAVDEGELGLAAVRNNSARNSLSTTKLARRSPNQSEVAPAEGAAVLASTYQAGLRVQNAPALAGLTPPPLGGAVAATPKPAPAKAAAPGKPAGPSAAAPKTAVRR